jgi:uncharacterized protein (TIGR03435 family)
MALKLAAAAAMALALAGQSFDVVSIRPSRNAAAESNLDSLPSGRLTATNITVGELVRLAYAVKDYQIERAPAWMATDGFDIAATGPPSRNEAARIRGMLEERFHLLVHHETKDGRVFHLVAAKGGPKLTPHNDGTGTRTRKGCGHLAGSRVTADAIATMLSREVERDVVNRTGLGGKFDFQLDWSPDTRVCPAEDDAPVRPSLYTAVEQQLGLKLEPARGPVEVLVIDRLERPGAN